MSVETITITEAQLRDMLRRAVNAASIDAAANISDDAVVERLIDTPAWREAWPLPVAPGTTGTATLNNLVSGNGAFDMRVMRVEWDGLHGFATQTGRIVEDGSTTWSISDFVPDETHPLPTREQRAQVVDLLIAFSNDRADEWDTADKILALLSGGAR